MPNQFISPSMLASDFGNIKSQVEMLNKSEADYLHIDIMDGVFVPNISFGFPVCKAINKYASKPLDYHLMIENADPYLKQCVDNGAEIVSVHIEACKHLHRTLSAIKDLGAKAGIALNPHTSVNLLDGIIDMADLVLIMSVNPGFGGQKFIESTYTKISELRTMAEKSNPDLLIEVDGGVNLENAPKLIKAGANILVAGSFVFKSENPSDTISKLKHV